jgi:hypothetical protein
LLILFTNSFVEDNIEKDFEVKMKTKESARFCLVLFLSPIWLMGLLISLLILHTVFSVEKKIAKN